MSMDEMTSYERVMTALRGGQPDRTPVIPFVREWCAKQVGFRFKDLLESIEKHVYAQYYCLTRYGYDAVFDLDGIHAESEAMGSVLKLSDDSPPSLLEPAVKDYDRDLGKLRIPDPYRDGRMPFVLEGNRRLKDLCRGKVPVVGYMQAPFRHACMLRGAEHVMRDTVKNQERLKELLDIATDSLIVYGSAVAHSGADIIFMPDPTSSGDMVSRKIWEQFGLPYTKRLVHAVKKTGVPIILHICGDTSDRLDSLAETGADGLSLDSKVSLAVARKTLGDSVCLIGNVNPVDALLRGTPEDVRRESEACIRSAGTKGSFLLTSGCLIAVDTPPENIQAMVDTAKDVVLPIC